MGLFIILFFLPPIAMVVFMVLIRMVKVPRQMETIDRQPAFPVVDKKISEAKHPKKEAADEHR